MSIVRAAYPRLKEPWPCDNFVPDSEARRLRFTHLQLRVRLEGLIPLQVELQQDARGTPKIGTIQGVGHIRQLPKAQPVLACVFVFGDQQGKRDAMDVQMGLAESLAGWPLLLL